MAEISTWPDRETSSRALQLLSTIRQSELCIALLILKKIFGYSVVLCKVLQKVSLDLLEAVNVAQDINKELKSVRENAKHEFHQLYECVQETARTQNFTMEAPRRTSRMTNRCNIASATTEEYFCVAIFIPFLNKFIASLEAKFTAHKSVIGRFQCLIPADPSMGPSTQQMDSVQALGHFYHKDVTKSPEERVPELKLWLQKLSRLNKAKKPTDVLSSIKECCPNAFPNIFTLITILLTPPVTTCTSERSFSTLRSLKTYLRNSTGTTRMNGLALLHIYRAHSPSPEDVINRFNSSQRRLDFSL